MMFDEEGKEIAQMWVHAAFLHAPVLQRLWQTHRPSLSERGAHRSSCAHLLTPSLAMRS